ncbi:MAG TPA: NAD(P)H-dependent oxidoreductase [Chitinophagaceae bacterium]|nr:NAD(P)H-dependent oxidoreductase [Chitinophagaceae bacterium]
MNHLVIYAHPNKDSLNGELKETVINRLKTQGHDIIVRDLYQMNFNPVLSSNDIIGQLSGESSEDVIREQKFISRADTLTFIHPIWWTGLPAIMKGYIDRVFTYGFAYRYDQGIQKGLLKGKQAVIINTQGKSHQEYQAIGMDQALKHTSETGIYAYCGLDIKEHFFFDQADKATAEDVKDWKKQVVAVYDRLYSTT